MGDVGDLGLWSAFLAGLAASGHCASMCGGVAGALAMRTQQAGSGSKLAMGLAYNVARVGSYALARALNQIPGVVENGLFIGIADLVVIGREDGSTELIEAAQTVTVDQAALKRMIPPALLDACMKPGAVYVAKAGR